MAKLRASLAATLLAALAPISSALAEPQATKEEAARYHGWGLAIAYLAVGEKCAGALSAEDMGRLQAFIASGLAYSRQTEKKFDHDKFIDTFHDEMVRKYSSSAACTPAVIKEARQAVTTVRERGFDPN